jgi:hypothetical protein
MGALKVANFLPPYHPEVGIGVVSIALYSTRSRLTIYAGILKKGDVT